MRLIEEDWQEADTVNHRSVMMRSAKFGNFIIIICASFMFSGGFFYHILIPLTAPAVVTENNITVQPFPTPAFGKFFTSGYSPVYQIVFTVQAFTGIFNDTLNVMTFSLATVLILHSCGQFDVLILTKNDISSHSRLVLIVQRHLRVLSFVKTLEGLLTEVCLIEVMGSTIIICLLGYYIIVVKISYYSLDIHFTIKKYYQTINNFFAFSYVSYLDKVFCEIFLVEILGCAINLSLLGYFSVTNWKAGNLGNFINFAILLNVFIFNIFIYAYFGELLTIQAEKVGNTGYMIEWHKLPRNISLELSFFIQVCQFPIRVTAGKVVFLSMTTFTAIIKSAAAYLNIIWKM
ncbi:odorant receptor 13a-like [Leptopilina heterotoma]|uniref:odorant receptor 13a-like n=1 Tax=Leptopilina heterotoma TaxID=63436 RepID=UPI001CA9E54F|nr:odorant receptor 13a-like [Leptopilina heterotoma]